MKKNGKKQGWPGHLFVILASMVLLTSWALCGTYAKYVSTATGSSMARVAKFEVTDQGGWEQETGIAAQIAPGEKLYYKVEVINKSEVTISCQLSGEGKYKTIQLKVSMTDENKKELPDGSAVIEAATNADSPQKHIYYACISWDENVKDASYAGKTDLVSITFKAVQAD